MKTQKIILYVFVFTGLGCIVITMFHPFQDFYNRLIPTIIIAFLVCLGYYAQTVRNIDNDSISKIEIEKEISTIENTFDLELELKKITTKIDILQTNNLTFDQLREKQLQFICNEFEFVQGIIFEKIIRNGDLILKKSATYAFFDDKEPIDEIEWGTDLTGNTAKVGEFVYLEDVPKGLIKVASGLGVSNPNTLLLFPFKKDNQVIGVLELASFEKFDEIKLNYFKKVFQYLLNN